MTKKFTITLLGVIFVALIACSIQSISADHLEPGEGIFKDKSEVNLVTTQDSDYQVYLHTILRNVDGQLINVTENTKIAAHIPHEITDYVFDMYLGEKEIITIDNIKYEKVRYTFSPTLEQRWMGMYPISEQIKINIEMEGDALVQINKKPKDYSLWKIHHCATFKGHGYDCIPIFQVLVPTMTLQTGDVVTQQWTILRIIN